MKVVMIYGEFSSAIHGPFDIDGLYTRQGLTGSESSFFNLARSLAEKNHEVVVFCVVAAETAHPSGFHVFPIREVSKLSAVRGIDAVVVWNEPDYLQFAPAGAHRYCAQQLNDWPYVRATNWPDLVDTFVFPSENSRQHHIKDEGLAKAGPNGTVIPNSVDLDLFKDAPQRIPHKAVYCSSPDRGLHHVLSMWPDVRRHVPDAELHVFYRLAPWMKGAREQSDAVGARARYIENALKRMDGLGVVVRDLVSNATMARELQSAGCLIYPCDPVTYTEGFGCSVLDAATAGCIPIISTADALEEVHGEASVGIRGNPAQERGAWVTAVVAVMNGQVDNSAGERMQRHAQKHSRNVVSEQWVRLLERNNAQRSSYAYQDISRPDVSLR